jgi:hypothetical protein
MFMRGTVEISRRGFIGMNSQARQRRLGALAGRLTRRNSGTQADPVTRFVLDPGLGVEGVSRFRIFFWVISSLILSSYFGVVSPHGITLFTPHSPSRSDAPIRI